LRDFGKVKPNKSDLVQEPPCWGSGEIPLLPAEIKRALRGVQLSGVAFVGTAKKPASSKNEKKLMLADFAEETWVQAVKGFSWDAQQSTMVDLVVRELDETFFNKPHEFEVPVLAKRLDRAGGITSLPFELRTWSILENHNLRSSHELLVLLQGTFREIREQLEDCRATLDFIVTTNSWLEQSSSGTWSFHEPRTDIDLLEAARWARLRVFRCCGLDPTLSSYTSDMADVLPRNWSVTTPKKWTLEMCGKALGLTRERVRQVVNLRQFHAAERRWPRPISIVKLAGEYQLRRQEAGDPELVSFPRILRSESKSLLLAYGYSPEELRSIDSVSSDLKAAEYRPFEIRRAAYRATERVGFATATDVTERLLSEFPRLSETALNDILATVLKIRDLPLGYIYVDGSEGSYFGNDISRLLGLRGRLPFEELYLAAVRFYRVRVPGFILPPRSVIREFFNRDERFWYEDEYVDLSEPKPHRLSGVQLWVEERIRESAGCVVHRSVLWDAARRDGISRGTLNVYFSYSMYHKPTGRGCLTLTGLFPSEDFVDIAVAKASLIRVPARLLKWAVDDGRVIVDLELGTETVDNGIFTPPAALRRLLHPTTFRVTLNGVQKGNLSWSGIMLYGLSSGLSARGSAPGDHLRMCFDSAAGEVELCDPPENLSPDD
jgi:hypothetical protein